MAALTDNLFPVIKRGQNPHTTVTDVKGVSHDIAPGAQLVIIPIFDELGVLIGKDIGPYYSFLTNMDIAPPLTADDYLERAYQNFLNQVRGTMRINLVREGMGFISNANRLESSLVLADHVWDDILNAMKVKDLLFSIPTQDLFAFADANNPEAIKILQEKTAETFNNPSFPKKISPSIYRKQQGKAMILYSTET